MVSSGQVTGDLNSLLTNLTSYTSHMGDLASSWKGPSYDNLSSKAEEFTNDYKSVISDGMNAFASACSTYVTFVATKQAYNDAVAKANAATDPDEKARWAAEAERLAADMEKLRTEINEFLAKASSNSLSASTVSIATPAAIAELQSATDKAAKDASSSATSTTSETAREQYISSVIDNAKAIAKDNRHGYSQPGRWSGKDYDCSSYVISCWEAAGVPVKSKYGANTTHNMRSTFQKAGFKCYPLSAGTKINLQPGDVLLNEGVHTALYLGNGKIIDATSNPANRDQIGVRSNSKFYGWNYVLRYDA